jgi:urea transporter
MLKDRYGNNYAADPKMLSLMELNGGRVQGFLSGAEEAEAFKTKDFIRMNTSTISKVDFFSFVISQVLKGKLKIASRGFVIFIDRLLESRKARVVAVMSAAIGLLVAVIQLGIWAASLWK